MSLYIFWCVLLLWHVAIDFELDLNGGNDGMEISRDQ